MLDLLRAGCSVGDLRQITIGEARILLEAWHARRAPRRKALKRALKAGKLTAVYDVGWEVE